MDALDQYINKIKEQTREFNELETVRYVYIDLGRIMSFDPSFFFGNEKNRIQIYKDCDRNKEKLNEYLEDGIIICRSISYVLEHILAKLDIHVETIIDDDEHVYYSHVLNMVILKDGSSFLIDLQHDLENLQIHSRTKYFGSGVFSKEELEALDMKVGYITEDNTYTEDYFYMLKQALNSDIPLNQKVEFILSNLNVYTDISNMKYVERKNYYCHFVQKFITSKEKNKIHFYDCYQMKAGPKEYQLCIVVEMTCHNNIYLYSNKSQSFDEYSLEEIVLLVKNGLVILGNIPGLKKYLNQSKQKIKD